MLSQSPFGRAMNPSRLTPTKMEHSASASIPLLRLEHAAIIKQSLVLAEDISLGSPLQRAFREGSAILASRDSMLQQE
jgi:hypothetical protein